jgi:uncharacterized protein
MSGETNLGILLKSMHPILNDGEYVFCTTKDPRIFKTSDVISFFKENEGITIILEKERADELGLEYTFIASWITLTVHSSLEAVGLTAAFASALSTENISCNVVAGFYHDHIFVDRKDALRAIDTLNKLSVE